MEISNGQYIILIQLIFRDIDMVSYWIANISTNDVLSQTLKRVNFIINIAQVRVQLSSISLH